MIQVAKLDTGSEHNLISREVALATGLRMEDYEGPSVQSLDSPAFYPQSQVTVNWHKSGEDNEPYETIFAVLEDQYSLNLVHDVLIRRQDIKPEWLQPSGT